MVHMERSLHTRPHTIIIAVSSIVLLEAHCVCVCVCVCVYACVRACVRLSLLACQPLQQTSPSMVFFRGCFSPAYVHRADHCVSINLQL
jgi:hypothetical protein